MLAMLSEVVLNPAVPETTPYLISFVGAVQARKSHNMISSTAFCTVQAWSEVGEVCTRSQRIHTGIRLAS